MSCSPAYFPFPLAPPFGSISVLLSFLHLHLRFPGFVIVILPVYLRSILGWCYLQRARASFLESSNPARQKIAKNTVF